MKVLINNCYGGFSLNEELQEKIANELGLESTYETLYLERHDPVMIKIVEEHGLEKSGGFSAELKIVEVPDGCRYSIHEYDGMEYIQHTWVEIPESDLIKGLSKEQLELVKKCTFFKVAL
jgi:hypothetical protein